MNPAKYSEAQLELAYQLLRATDTLLCIGNCEDCVFSDIRYCPEHLWRELEKGINKKEQVITYDASKYDEYFNNLKKQTTVED